MTDNEDTLMDEDVKIRVLKPKKCISTRFFTYDLYNNIEILFNALIPKFL